MSRSLMSTQNDATDKGGKVAFELYQGSKKLAQKLKWLNLASRRGHPQAMLDLAEHYVKGDGLRMNKAKAFKLIESAAKQDYAEAQYRIGLLLKNPSEGFSTRLKGKWYKWFIKAAEQGHAGSQFEYAQYLSDSGSSQGYNWLMRSARQGFAAAQYQLGYNFYYGHGVKKDRYIGKQWIEYAAGQGHAAANEFIRRHPIQPALEY